MVLGWPHANVQSLFDSMSKKYVEIVQLFSRKDMGIKLESIQFTRQGGNQKTAKIDHPRTPRECDANPTDDDVAEMDKAAARTGHVFVIRAGMLIDSDLKCMHRVYR